MENFLALSNSPEFWAIISGIVFFLVIVWRLIVLTNRLPSSIDIPVSDGLEQLQEYAKERKQEAEEKLQKMKITKEKDPTGLVIEKHTPEEMGHA